jgi:hypothetical protein
VALIVASLAGTLGLIVAMQRRAAPTPAARPKDVPPVVAQALPAEPAPEPEPEPSPPPVAEAPPAPAPPPAPPKPVEDPTKPVVARLAAEEAAQRLAASEADRQAEALEAARRSAVAESQRWRRREALVRAQVDALAGKADRLEKETDELALERDLLAQERDAARAELARTRASGGGYAVLPHKGPNGTWQRPVVIECRNGHAIVQPRGLAFSMLDLSGLLGPRSSPFIAAVAQELMKVQLATSPDGAPIVPYFYFLVRPDGIRPFYEARARLEPLGIAFGYELVDQDWKIDVPDLDTWDESGLGRPKSGGPSPGGEFTWPADRPGSGQHGGAGDPRLWPRGPSGAPGSGTGDVPLEIAGSDAPGGGAGTGRGPGRAPVGPPGANGNGVGVGAGSGRLGGAGRGDDLEVSPPLTPFAGRGRGGASGGPRGLGGGRSNSGPDVIVLPVEGGSGGPAPLQPVNPGGLPGFDRAEDGAGALSPPSRTLPAPGTSSAPGSGLGTSPPGTSGNAVSVGLAGQAGSEGVGHGVGGPSEAIAPPQPGPLARRGEGEMTPLSPGGRGVGGEGDRSNPSPPKTLSGFRAPAQGSAGGWVGGGAVAPSGGSGLGQGQPGSASAPPAGGDASPGTTGFGPLAQGAAGGTGSTTGTASGRVPIDPATLQDDGFEDRPPAAPMRLGGGQLSESPSAGGFGQPSGSGGGSETVGIGLPSGGTSASAATSDSTAASASGAPTDGTPVTSGTAGSPGSTPPTGTPSPSGLPSFAGLVSNTGAPRDHHPSPSRKPESAPTRNIQVNVPLELVVACGPDGVVIHPGGYRISFATLKRERRLVRDLETIVRNHELIDPSIHPQPRVRFLVERAGSDTYWEAKRQTVFTDLKWPMSVQIAETSAPRVFAKERF